MKYLRCKNKQFGYDRCCFWVLWLIKWENQHKKRILNGLLNIEMSKIDHKFRSNVIWIVWDIINVKNLKQEMKNIRSQIAYLYKLFTNDYTLGKRNSRLPILFHAFGYLTHDINFSIPLRSDFKLFIDVQCNVNKMFGAKKKTEQS